MNAQFHVLSSDGPELRVREHRKRRHHTKDSHGCLSCKQKHVKVRVPVRCHHHTRRLLITHSATNASRYVYDAQGTAESASTTDPPLTKVRRPEELLSMVLALFSLPIGGAPRSRWAPFGPCSRPVPR